jgi:hypothetical protein
MSENTLTIIFRGLMVLHQQGSGAGSSFEVGIHSLPEDHIFRINTVTNGVLDATKIFTRDDIKSGERDWILEIDDAVEPGPRRFTDGTDFRRLTQNNDPEDFQWIMDVESAEFFGPLSRGEIATANLRPVLRIPQGKFYTRLKSAFQTRRKDSGSFDDFGEVGAAIGCDIRLRGPEARLVSVSQSGENLLQFAFDATARHTIYEIVNTPPDTEPPDENHFDHYYHDLLSANLPKFTFQPKGSGGPPAPRPALCGEIFLGARTDRL